MITTPDPMGSDALDEMLDEVAAGGRPIERAGRNGRDTWRVFAGHNERHGNSLAWAALYDVGDGAPVLLRFDEDGSQYTMRTYPTRDALAIARAHVGL